MRWIYRSSWTSTLNEVLSSGIISQVTFSAEYNGDHYDLLFAKKEKQAFATSFYNEYVCEMLIKKYRSLMVPTTITT